MPDSRPAWSLFLDVLHGPRAAMAGVAARADPREGRAAMLVLGTLHGAFSLLLYVSGYAPRFGVPGLGRDSHYLLQAILAVPLYLVLWRIGGGVAHAVARRGAAPGGEGSRKGASLAVFGVSYAVPMTLFFIVPDIAVYLALGFTAIGKAMRYYAPLAAAACLVLGTMGFSRAHPLRTRTAFLAALAGFVTQALLGALFLR
ncbi:YIP1 family protein [Polyangium sorediatum]|uniref:YIP1 family protein n=1 Tax=Polyangium sorediatum TaxID=889274 RepID=A0ABT6NX57_9BACT|nr:YIP1 family protein [Polyangium sorediatum]MDI1432908.1 YIP1 family protein [Polyangium sorediatum]